MGHIKLDLVPQDEMPRDVKLGVRMQREGAAGVGRRTFGPPCIPSWSSWQVQTSPDPIVPGEPFTYYAWPASDSVLCDGDCLEWAAQWSGCPGADPSYTLTAGEDCVGAIVAVDDTAEAVEGCTLTLTAMLNGSSFGPPVELVIGPACTFNCTGIDVTGTTYPDPLPQFPDPGYTIDVTIQGELCDLTNDDIVWSYQWFGAPDEFGFSMTSLGPPGSFQFDIYSINGFSAAGTYITWTASVDFGFGLEPICSDVTFTCEV